MNQPDPLHGHPLFANWGLPHPWGCGTASFGAVIDDLIKGVDHFIAESRTNTLDKWSTPAAVGCVPWMNHERLIASLATLNDCCIVMNKGANDLKGALALQANGSPFRISSISGMTNVGRVDSRGLPPLIGPSGTSGDVITELGPVRLAGSRIGGRSAPILHAKMLVLGDRKSEVLEDDPFFGELFESFLPRMAWIGSANWTKGSEHNLEFGIWVEEPALVNHVYRFVVDVIRFSEPIDTAHQTPTPVLVDAVWDDEAFYHYMDDIGLYAEEPSDPPL